MRGKKAVSPNKTGGVRERETKTRRERRISARAAAKKKVGGKSQTGAMNSRRHLSFPPRLLRVFSFFSLSLSLSPSLVLSFHPRSAIYIATRAREDGAISISWKIARRVAPVKVRKDRRGVLLVVGFLAKAESWTRRKIEESIFNKYTEGGTGRRLFAEQRRRRGGKKWRSAAKVLLMVSSAQLYVWLFSSSFIVEIFVFAFSTFFMSDKWSFIFNCSCYCLCYKWTKFKSASTKI